MSSRPGFIIDHRVRTDNGGVSPNAYVAQVSVQLRVNAPPLCRRSEVREAICEAFNQALDQLEQEAWQ